MKELLFYPDFDVDETTEEITEIMSKWSIQLLDINGPTWVVYDYDMDIKYIIRFLINFDDLETRLNFPTVVDGGDSQTKKNMEIFLENFFLLRRRPDDF